MEQLIVNGGKKLSGEVEVEGAKNSVLPILAATVLNSAENIIRNCPDLKDVEVMVEILKKIGCKVRREEDNLIIDSSNINTTVISKRLSSQLRASVIFMGSMLARFKEVTISYPGGYVMLLIINIICFLIWY